MRKRICRYPNTSWVADASEFAAVEIEVENSGNVRVEIEGA